MEVDQMMLKRLLRITIMTIVIGLITIALLLAVGIVAGDRSPGPLDFVNRSEKGVTLDVIRNYDGPSTVDSMYVGPNQLIPVFCDERASAITFRVRTSKRMTLGKRDELTFTGAQSGRRLLYYRNTGIQWDE